MIPQGLKRDQITPHNFQIRDYSQGGGGKRKPVERAMKEKSNTSFKRKNFTVLLQKGEDK